MKELLKVIVISSAIYHTIQCFICVARPDYMVVSIASWIFGIYLLFDKS